MHKLVGFSSLLASAAIFGSFGIWVRFLSYDFTSFQQMGIKCFGAFFFAVIAMALSKHRLTKELPKKEVLLFVVSSLVGTFLFTVALLNSKIATVIFGLFVGSISSSLIAGVFLYKEKLTPIKNVALVVVFIGLCIYSYPITLGAENLGLLLGVCVGLLDTSLSIARKNMKGKIDRFALLTLYFFCGSAIVAIILTFTGQWAVPHISTLSIFSGVVYGFLTCLAAFLMLIGFQNFDLHLGTIVLASELFFATMMGAVFFREYPLFTEIIGSLLIITAIVMLNLPSRKHPQLETTVSL